jgi:hypothetical protein
VIPKFGIPLSRKQEEMMPPTSRSLKKGAACRLLLISAVVTAYAAFIGLVSIWVGVSHKHQPGFCVPIVAGAVLFVSVVYACLRLFRHVLTHLKPEDIVKL